jgi:hypothetical protein
VPGKEDRIWNISLFFGALYYYLAGGCRYAYIMESWYLVYLLEDCKCLIAMNMN